MQQVQGKHNGPEEVFEEWQTQHFLGETQCAHMITKATHPLWIFLGESGCVAKGGRSSQRDTQISGLSSQVDNGSPY